MEQQEEILTIKQAAALLQLTEQTLYRLKAEHKIPYKKIGGAIRFSKLELVKWVQNGELA